MKTANITVPLNMAYDTRGMAANTNMAAGKDQRRVNSYYENLRESMQADPAVILSKRPGVTADAGTYGAGTQIQYVVGFTPGTTWDSAPCIFVKDGSDSKVVTSGASTTILNSSDYYPRFFDTVLHGTTHKAVIQLQNTTTPTATPAQRVFVSTDLTTWTEITDDDFDNTYSARGKMEHLDGYAFIASHNNRIYQSGLNDLTTWGTNDFLGRTIVQDAPQGLMKVRSHILFFGEDTVEVYTNAGNATGSVLGRVPFSAQRIGLGSVAGGGSGLLGKTSYYTTIGNMGFFVGRYGGNAKDSSCIMYNGQNFEKISRSMEDKILSSTTVYSINRVTFGGKVAVGIQLTLPTASTQRWLMYFPEINEWFEWESTVFSPVNNGRYYAGIANPQKLYYFDTSDNWQDAGTNYTMTTQFRLPFGDLKWRSMSFCGIIADSLTSSQNLGISFSDDDGSNWSTARNIDLSKRRKEITGCGGFMERSVRLTHTDSGEVRLRRFYSHVSPES